ncbi:MAG: PLP-dependent aminotransferase family protein [Chloroflexota bacterium]
MSIITPTDWSSHFADRTDRMRGSAIRELLKLLDTPEVISFAGGIPANEALPAHEVAEACNRILETNAVTALQYGPTEGYNPLREQIVEMYRARGVPATIDNVLIITGSQQGLDLVGKTLINEDDTVLIESPTYTGALLAWLPYAPNFLAVPMDDGGIVLEDANLTGRAKLLYLLPNFQNPTGISLTAERRPKAIEFAQQHQLLIVEDDPYRELRYSGEALPALVEVEAAMLGSQWDSAGRVIHLGTFSKTLAPGLRVGWMLASSTAIKMFTRAKQAADLHTSTLSMMIADDLMRHKTLDKNIPALRDLYRERRDAILEALAVSVGSRGTWTRPDGGLFVWMTLPGETDTPGLLAEGLKKNVAFVPGDAFYFDGRGTDALRLNFSANPPNVIHEGIARLGSLIAERQDSVKVKQA